MPRTYRRNCDECSDWYEGLGARFCSPSCVNLSRRPVQGKLPPRPDEEVRVDLDEEIGSVMVMASKAIKTPDELFAKAELDPDVWEIVPDSVTMKTWPVQMKVEGHPITVPCYYVAMRVRKTWEHCDNLPSPVVLRVTRPLKRKPDPGAYSLVVYGDEHFPHHGPQNLNILYQILDFVNPNMTWGLGDTLDCEQLGRWPKDPFNRTSLKEECRMAAEHLGIVHALTPNAEHGWMEGNHEDRLRKEIWSAMEKRSVGEVMSLPGVKEVLEWPHQLGIDALGWETLTYTGAGGANHKLLFDKLILKHGDKVGPKAGSAATKEREMYHKSGISGHTHRQAYIPRRDYSSTNGWWEQGLLGQIREDYVAHADWQNGFSVVTWSADRSRFGVELVSIHDGVAYFRGQRFEGDAKSFGVLAT